MKKSRGIFIGGLILLVCVVLFICFKFGWNSRSNSCENVLMDMCEAIEDCDYEKYNSFFDRVFNKYSPTEKESKELAKNELIDYINTEYGPNVEITFKINLVAYEYTISGDGGSDSDSGIVAMAEIDGKWYPGADIIIKNYREEVE